MKKLLLIPLAVLLALILAITALGCSKVTGGGMFLDDYTGDRVTFSFNVKPIEESGNEIWIDLEGSFRLNDTQNGIRVSGQSKADDANFRYWFADSSFGAWEVTVNGEDGYNLWITPYDDDGSLWFYLNLQGPTTHLWGVYEQDIKGKIKFHE